MSNLPKWAQEVKARLDRASPKWKQAGDWYHDCLVGCYIHGDGENDENDSEVLANAKTDLSRCLDALATAIEALELTATPKRPDGTYNRCREACEELARTALAKIRGKNGEV